jgi:hypothetical protein
MNELYSDRNNQNDVEQEKLQESNENEDIKESFTKRVFGSNLNLNGLSFREKMEKIIES